MILLKLYIWYPYYRLEAISKEPPEQAIVHCYRPEFLSLLSDDAVAKKTDWIDLIIISLDLSLKVDDSMCSFKAQLVAALVSKHLSFFQEVLLLLLLFFVKQQILYWLFWSQIFIPVNDMLIDHDHWLSELKAGYYYFENHTKIFRYGCL